MPVYTTASSTTTTGDAWFYWCGGSSTATTTTASTSDVWVQWCDQTGTASSTSIWTGTSARQTRETEADRLAREERYRREVEEYRQRLAAEEKARKEAEERAEKLLVENLSLRQRDELRKNGHFVVHGRSGCRYRIRRGRTANIDVIDRDGRITHRLCAHPAEQVPHPDTMLAQKLMLECDEDRFVRLANRHLHYGDARPVLQAMH